MKNLQYKIETLAVRGTLLTLKLLPPKAMHLVSRVFGEILYFSGIRRKIVETNLDIAFGKDQDKAERKRILRETYLNASTIMFEFLYMHCMKKEELSNYISVEGLDLIQEALKEKKGAVVAGNHFGNWEMVTAAISHFSEPIYVFTGMQKNKAVDDLINGIRRRFGTQTISKAKSAGFEMMKALKNNKPLGMAGDLNVPHDNLFIDFFGKKAVVGQGLTTFTLRKNAPLLFIWNERVSAMKYKGFVKRIYYQTTGDAEIDRQQVAQLISNELEDKIRKNPGQYFWFNRRWKTRPPEEASEAVYD